MKRAQAYGLLLWATFGFAAAVFFILYPTYLLNPVGRNEYAGATSAYLLQAHHEAQQRLLFIDQAGQYALYDALHDLADQGGFVKNKEKCGRHVHNLWSTTNPRKECSPNPPQSLEQTYPADFEKYFEQTAFPYPKDNYDYEYAYTPTLQILGKAKNNLLTQAWTSQQHGPLTPTTPSLYATVSVKPSYKVGYNPNLDVYERIKQWTEQTLRECYDDPPACVEETIQQHNQRYNSKEPDDFKLSLCKDTPFVEPYYDCVWTSQKDCICTLPMPSQEMTQIRPGRIEIQRTAYETKTPSALGMYAGHRDENLNFFRHLPGDAPKLAVYPDSKPGETLTQLQNIEPYPALYVYKEKNDELTLLKDPVYASGRNVPSCTINKTRIALCAQTHHELPFIEPGKVEWKNTTIRFALELQDRTPPETSFAAYDRKSITPQFTRPIGTEPSDGILVNWQTPRYTDGRLVEDLDHYLIYCDHDVVFDPLKKRTPTYAVTFDNREKVTYYTGTETVLVDTRDAEARGDTYETIAKQCEDDVIHDDPKHGQPLYAFYVTAIDKNGNERKDIHRTATVCPSSYYLENPPPDPTGTLYLMEYQPYFLSVRPECYVSLNT